MNERAITTLEFDKILEQLAEYTLSGLGRKLVRALRPMSEVAAITHALQETSETRAILDRGGYPPLSSLTDVFETVEKLARGAILQPPELLQIADLLRGSERMKRYMEDKGDYTPLLHAYSFSITDLPELEEVILLSIEGGSVSSSASARLKSIRSKIRTVESRIQDKLHTLLSSAVYQNYLQESYVTVKDGRYTIPVKAAYKHKIDGMVIGASGSGSTVFLEPTSVRKLVNELQVLRSEEEAECYQVLAMLSGMAGEKLTALKLNIETMAVYDFAFAKGKFSRQMEACEPKLNSRRRISLMSARHPLLPKGCVPLNFEIGQSYRTLLITGPNTGGKTIVLKTVGLLTLMAQSGLHIPAEPGSEVAVFSEVWVDIGDGQSIEQSLSTFSSHMGNIAGIMDKAGRSSMVLLDEIGTGTDPTEGAALGAAILDDLHAQGAVTVATTHYGDLKRFSEAHVGFENGMMEFDPMTLTPLYRLVIGEAGSSNGIWIAHRLGLKPSTIEKARHLITKGTVLFVTPESPVVEQDAPAPVPDRQETGNAAPAASASAIDETLPQKTAPQAVFTLGDRVFVHTVKQSGVVVEVPDAKGMMLVMCRRQPVAVNHKRVTLERKKEELYPDHETYDLRVVTMSKADRRKAQAMEKGHAPGVRRTVTRSRS